MVLVDAAAAGSDTVPGCPLPWPRVAAAAPVWVRGGARSQETNASAALADWARPLLGDLASNLDITISAPDSSSQQISL